ncbi:MAG: M48 family metallopeptidase [Rhodocyclaceae bacterium]|nr:M48 family metallopeptidase [Rhodocyclaceae bacterium]
MTFSILFLLALTAGTTLHLWLILRQARHVLHHRAGVPSEFSERISLADHQKAADYTQAKARVSLVLTVVEAVLLLIFTFGGLLRLLDEFWASLIDSSILHGLALFASVGAVGFVVDLPFSIFRTFVIESRFGFNKMTPTLYGVDILKQLLLTTLIGAPLLGAVLWLMGAVGSLWWLAVWMTWLGINLLALLVYPTWIAPMFNKFSPLPEGPVKTRIEALLARCHFTASGLFVMDGSKRTGHGNAYFTGLGKAKRIVFFDTLIEKLQPPEVEAVLAHELGHFKHRHIQKRIFLIALLSFLLLALLGVLIDKDWFYESLNVGYSADHPAMALILFSMVLPVFSFPLAPLMSWLSRQHEFEADDYAARHTNPTDLISALVGLYRDNAATLTPDPIYSMFHDSHPPAAVRIARLKVIAH